MDSPLTRLCSSYGKPTEKGEGFYSWKSEASRLNLCLETGKNGTSIG
jgi:hypothetical protein